MDATASGKIVVRSERVRNTAVIQRVYALSAGLVVNKHLPLHIAYEEEYTAVIQAATYLKPGSYVPMTPFNQDERMPRYHVCLLR